MKAHLNKILIGIIAVSIVFGVFLNIKKQMSVDKSRLPLRVVEERLFQRWITNLKNKDLDISADDFSLKEQAEIYNTTWMTVKSAENPEEKALYDETIEIHTDMDKVVFSPNGRVFVDFRGINRGNVKANEVRVYGLKEDKILDARVLDCSIKGNCYFDRAYFLDNDVFVITEFSRNISKRDTSVPECGAEEICTYTIKLHYVDMIHNTRLVYESKPFDIVIDDWMKNF
ncbi:hypothetical protein K0B04_02605 [Patescibacteria group bacterium]|nr:hypothetical protein [Patescibacteria group bacterium]